MTGFVNFNFDSFDAAAELLEGEGWGVFNPAQIDRDNGEEPKEDGVPDHPMRYYMARDLPLVTHSDAVFLLPQWERSRGARLEVRVALELDIPVFELERFALEGVDPQVPPHVFDIELLDAAFSPATPEPLLFLDRLIDGSMQRGGVVEIEWKGEPGDIVWDEPQKVFVPIDEYESEERIVDSGTGGMKGQKLSRFDLIPPDAHRALARHYGIGALKYDDDNWLKGYSWKLSLGAAGRHLNAFAGGESVYTESFVGRDGTPYEVETHHLIALAWQAFTLWVFETRGLGNDDRVI